MHKFAVFYMFSEATSSMALQRLRRLRAMNPDALFIPVVGMRQFLYFPGVVDEFMLGPTRQLRLIGPVSHLINSIFQSVPGVFRLAKEINGKVGTLTGNSKLTELKNRARRENIQTIHADYTPMIYFNGDAAIMNWFNTAGKTLNFEYLIFYEFDMYTTKPLQQIYKPYLESFDACFKDYEEATPSWHFYNYPPGCSSATRKWLRRRKLKTKLFRSLFGGCIISHSILKKLSDLNIDFSGEPYCFAEMRLPTVITNLGFKCGKLDFPNCRFRPIWQEKEIYENEDGGIFHPVKFLTSVEIEFSP
jgi:hypothetical protein